MASLAAGVAHDFNNILAVVKGNACLLLEGKSPRSSGHQAAGKHLLRRRSRQQTGANY